MCLILPPALEREADLRYQKKKKAERFKNGICCYRNSYRYLVFADFDR